MKRQRVTRRRWKTVAEYLQQTGQSQEQYAEHLGVSQSRVSQIVRGAPVSRKLAAAIHADTGIPLEQLMQLKSEAGRGA